MSTHESDEQVPEPIPVDLLDDGLLWLINASVFHPRGFALAQNWETGALTMAGDGSEPWTFPDTPEIHEKFRAAEAFFQRARLAAGGGS